MSTGRLSSKPKHIIIKRSTNWMPAVLVKDTLQ